MDKIRIGNELIVNWNITRIGKPEDLESKKLKLFLRTGFDKMEISEYIVKDSVISFNFYGKDQVHTGIYVCVLVENGGELGMTTIDSSPAFELVPYNGMTRKTGYPFVIDLSSDITIGDGSAKAEKELIFTNVMGLGQTAYDFIVDTYTNGKIIVDIDEAGKYSVCPHLNINEGSIEMLFSPLVSNDGISQMIIRVTKGSAPTKEELKEPESTGTFLLNYLDHALDYDYDLVLGLVEKGVSIIIKSRNGYFAVCGSIVDKSRNTLTLSTRLNQTDVVDYIFKKGQATTERTTPGKGEETLMIDWSMPSSFNTVSKFVYKNIVILNGGDYQTVVNAFYSADNIELSTSTVLVGNDTKSLKMFKYTFPRTGSPTVTEIQDSLGTGGVSSFILNVSESDLYQKALAAYDSEYILITTEGVMYFLVASKYKAGDNIVFSYMQGGMGLVDLTIKPDNTTDSNSSNLCVTVDALDNESMTDPLSARQGKLLNDRLTALETAVNKLMAGTF